MKKNKMMRTAAVLGIAALLSTSALSGTLAKYTTTAESSDSARVAKWGVSITMADDDSIFKSTYDKNDSSNTSTEITDSVVASNYTNAGTGDKIVAPGTTGSTEFTIAGKPEVAFNLKVKADVTSTIKVSKDTTVNMKAGEFEDTAVSVKPSQDYEPIVFKLEKKDTSKNDTYAVVTKSEGGNAENMTLTELQTELDALTKDYSANTEVNDTYKITWSWPFTTEFSSYDTTSGNKTYTNADVLDTYLGNQTGDDVQKESYRITITATQID